MNIRTNIFGFISAESGDECVENRFFRFGNEEENSIF
jgi:hypothetical protein